jgi:hypothetical protein
MSEGFQHAIAGGQGKLVIAQLQSPNFKLSPLTGWAVLKNGEAYFADVIVSGSFEGNDFLVTSVGMFFYSGTPALGNLILSVVPGTSTVSDPYGNTAQPGFTSYASATFWAQLMAGILNFATTGTYTNAAFGSNVPGAAYMSSGAAVSSDGIAEVLVEATSTSGLGGRLVELIAEYVQQGVSGTGTVTILNNCVINGTLSVNGSTNTGTPSNNNTSQNGLTDGTIHGTSGSQSAGTAHTHSAGSYAVGNGQHTHNLSSHEHAL